MTNLFGQEPHARRGESDTRLASVAADLTVLDARLDTAETELNLINSGAWIAYTPTLTQPLATAVTKTVIYAKYARIGRVIHAQVALLVTGTGTASEPVVIGLPVAAGDAVYRMLGSGGVWDDSAGALWTAQAVFNTTTTIGLVPSYSGGTWLGDAEFVAALAVNDEVYINVTYEAAS